MYKMLEIHCKDMEMKIQKEKRDDIHKSTLCETFDTNRPTELNIIMNKWSNSTAYKLTLVWHSVDKL